MGLENFGIRLSNIRKELGYTQEELALRLGVTAQAVSKWERGNGYPDIDLLYSLAAVLECSMDELCDFKKERIPDAELQNRRWKEEICASFLKEPIILECGVGLVELLMKEGKQGYKKLHEIRSLLAGECGILVPLIRIRDNIQLKEKEYRILIKGVEVARNNVWYPKLFYLHEKAQNQEDIEQKDPVWGIDGVWKSVLDEDTTEQGIEAFSFMCTHLQHCILEYYEKIMNRQIVSDMVELVQKRYPAVVDGVVPEKVGLALLQNVMIGLLKRHIALNPLDKLIELLEEAIETTKDTETLIKQAADVLEKDYRISDSWYPNRN